MQAPIAACFDQHLKTNTRRTEKERERERDKNSRVRKKEKVIFFLEIFSHISLKLTDENYMCVTLKYFDIFNSKLQETLRQGLWLLLTVGMKTDLNAKLKCLYLNWLTIWTQT